MTPADTVATAIIRAQAAIIGSIAWRQAAKVAGVSINQEFQIAHVSSDTKTVLTNLINRYEHLFGHAATSVSREGAGPHVASLLEEEIPSGLK